MNKQDFEILMNSLYSNNQLFIPQGQNIKDWIDNAFVDTQEQAINYSRCSTQLKDKYGEDFIVFLKNHTREQPVESIYWYKDTGYTNLDELYKKWLKITKPLIV